MPTTTTTNRSPTTVPAGNPNDAVGDMARIPASRPAPTGPVGQPIDRVDGRLKVTGQARYAAEAPMENIAHAVLISATIARGKVKSIDDSLAKAAPGVLLVMTPANKPEMGKPQGGIPVETRPPFADMGVMYAGQHVACVVADTLDHARSAAMLVKVEYEADPAAVGLDDPKADVQTPAKNMGEELQITRGDPTAALAAPGLAKIVQTYGTPTETHNPMELHATVAAWDGAEKLTVWDATQHIMGVQKGLASVFGLKPENVRVIDPFVGGGFGSKGAQWTHTYLCVAAARLVKRPVKLMLTRAQMFGSVGHRPETRQAMTLAATKSDNKLAVVRHDVTQHGARAGEFIEPCAIGTSRILYDTPSYGSTHTVRKIDVAPPTFMRAPGEASGSFGIECAMDELAIELGVDPLELRVTNHADQNPHNGKAWSSKHLLECYTIGAMRFGWSTRNATVGSMKTEDGRPMGWGVATATYPANRFPGSARIRLLKDDAAPLGIRVIGASATHDLGTGAYTVATQMTAELLGVSMESVKFELGDSTLPEGPVSGGSTTTATLGWALSQARDELKRALLKIAIDSAGAQPSPFAELPIEQVVLKEGKLIATSGPGASVALKDLVAHTGRAYVEAESPRQGQGGRPEDKAASARKDVAFHSFGVHFVEVAIDDPVPLVRVRRVVSVMNVGTVINPKTARSQVVGGVVMGVGMALTEHTVYDPRTGRPVNDNLADYAVPVNADIHTIETYFVDEPDYDFNPIGCRGVGEIGITGVAAAIANAVHHATGKRVRDLPITPDKLL